MTQDVDWQHPDAIYPYTDEHGALLFALHRYGHGKDKVVIPFTPDGKAGASEERVLYRLPHVRAQARAGGVVVNCEGEKDADAVAALGMCATTPPFSAWRPEYCASLQGASVVLLADRDPSGYAKAQARRACLLACGVPVAAVLRTPLDAPGADISDHLAAGMAWADLELVPDLLLWGLTLDADGHWDGSEEWRFPSTPRDGALPAPSPEFVAQWMTETLAWITENEAQS